MKYTYELQVHGEDRWFTLGGCRDVPLSWARGFIAGRQEASGPQLPIRILRSDGKIVEETLGKPEVSLGLIAGWPSAEQYERAAARALEKATKIREHEKHKEEHELLRRKI